MNEILMAVLSIVIPAFLAWVGTTIKNFLDGKVKKEIVLDTVKFVEQTCKSLTSEKKYNEALKKASEWLATKNITASETELRILIESSVNSLTKEIKGE